jgi:hypothetical protein
MVFVVTVCTPHGSYCAEKTVAPFERMMRVTLPRLSVKR